MICPENQFRTMCLVGLLLAVSPARAVSGASWKGVLSDSSGRPLREAVVKLRSASGQEYTLTTAGERQVCIFRDRWGGVYAVKFRIADQASTTATEMIIKNATALMMTLQLSPEGRELRVLPLAEQISAQASGGEHLSSAEVSSLPLNARDFSKLLLLAASTMTDANGAANFTLQSAVKGQRGSATVFARSMDSTPPTRNWVAQPSPTSMSTPFRKSRATPESCRRKSGTGPPVSPMWSPSCSHLGQLAYRGGLLTNALGLAAFLIAVVIHALDVDTSVFGVGFHSFRLKP